MNIKVAYDVAFLGKYCQSITGKAGIYRVAEELLGALLHTDSVDLKVVGLCGDNPIHQSLLAERYVRNCDKTLKLHYMNTVYSKLGMLDCLRKFYYSSFIRNASAIQGSSALSNIEWIVMKTFSPIENICVDQRLRTDDVDIFHSVFLKLPSRSVTEKVPRVITIYDLIPVLKPEYVDWKFKTFFNNILKSIDIQRDWVACVSSFTKKQFCTFTGMPEDRVFVTHLAASKHFYPVFNIQEIENCRQKYSIPKGDYFLALSSREPRKNLSHLIRCFTKVSANGTVNNTNLVLAGPPAWSNPSIKEALSKHSFQKSEIAFLGFVADEDLAALYSGAKAFIFPSLYEGFGMPTLEAMQCGVPVISSNATCLTEVIGDAGFLVDPTDSDALCHAMEIITSDECLHQKLSLAGLERAKKFSWAKCAEDIVSVYKKAVRG